MTDDCEIVLLLRSGDILLLSMGLQSFPSADVIVSNCGQFNKSTETSNLSQADNYCYNHHDVSFCRMAL